MVMLLIDAEELKLPVQEGFKGWFCNFPHKSDIHVTSKCTHMEFKE